MPRPILLLVLTFFILLPLLALASEDHKLAWVEIHDQRFYVEIAADNASRARGLMGREYMAPDRGMLFIFPDEQPRLFWMKNTFIALDIIYLDSQYEVVSMALGALPCKTPNCPMYPSRVPAKYVLEINAGLARNLHLKIGDQIAVSYPGMGLAP